MDKTIELTKNNNGNYTGLNDRGAQIVIYQVKDDYDYPTGWNWILSRNDKKWFGEENARSPQVALASLSTFIHDTWNKDIEMELL